jgi:tetratricopeptide (TPR) repeat protein
VADDPRIEELTRRIQKDPGSIAFAQLAEEYRRAGRFQESIEVCRSGLARHPGYLSARVTLGRALLEVGDFDSAYRELSEVVRVAPDNLSAIRGIAEVHRRRGELPEALEQFKSAFELAGPDPTIEQIVRDLRREVMQSPLPGASDQAPEAQPAGSRRGAPAGGAVALAGPPPIQRVASGDDPRVARRTVSYLERWLEAIMADRRSRLYAAPA